MDKEKRQEIIEAAGLLSPVLLKLPATGRGPHAETLVASAARMAGTLLYRSFGDAANVLQPGTPVLSEQANSRGPVLMNTLFTVLRQYGHDDLDAAAFKGARDTTASSLLTLAETQVTLEPWYRKTREAHGLSFGEIAIAGAMSTAAMVHICRRVLDVNRGCAIAVYGMVEGTKTVPAACPGDSA